MIKRAATKQTKNNSSDTHQDIRHLGVVIESVNDNVKLIAEQHGDIKNDIHNIKQTLNSHTRKLDSHTDMIGRLAVDMTIVKEDVKVMKKDIAATKTDVEIIKTDIEFIKGGLKKKVDYEEFSILERRVLLLEKRR